MQPMKLLRNSTVWGGAALVLLTVMSLTAAALYINPPGQKLVTFYTEDAATVTPGIQVRIAGVSVGKVKDLDLEANQVQVRMQIDGDAFVGDQSQIQVRLLTVVGGYYVNLVSLGHEHLGMKPIPVERVTMPYSLMRTLTDATKVTEEVDAKPINESLDEVQEGLTGTNLESLGAVIDAGNSLMSTIERQRGQVSAMLDLSDEYLREFNNFGDELRDMVRKIAILEQTLTLYSEGFASAMEGMGDVLDALSPVGVLYMNHRAEFLSKARDWLEKARKWTERDGLIVRALRLGRNKIQRVVDAQQAPPDLLATDLCMPIPGSPC